MRQSGKKRTNGAIGDKMRRSKVKRGGTDECGAKGRGDHLRITKRGEGSSQTYYGAFIYRSNQGMRGSQ
jgi:hypothetical protein